MVEIVAAASLFVSWAGISVATVKTIHFVRDLQNEQKIVDV